MSVKFAVSQLSQSSSINFLRNTCTCKIKIFKQNLWARTPAETTWSTSGPDWATIVVYCNVSGRPPTRCFRFYPCIMVYYLNICILFITSDHFSFICVYIGFSAGRTWQQVRWGYVPVFLSYWCFISSLCPAIWLAQWGKITSQRLPRTWSSSLIENTRTTHVIFSYIVKLQSQLGFEWHNSHRDLV